MGVSVVIVPVWLSVSFVRIIPVWACGFLRVTVGAEDPNVGRADACSRRLADAVFDVESLFDRFEDRRIRPRGDQCAE
jgi:hypothetical protein